MEVEVIAASTGKPVAVLADLKETATIYDVKKALYKVKNKYYPERQSLKAEIKGKTLKDEESLSSLHLDKGGQLYFKDLGPQIGWKTVFLWEYAGPLLVYLWIYQRPALFYGPDATLKSVAQVVHIAAGCWTIHYGKRLLETLFIHRFSHATMPIFSLFKNCMYYWGFAGYIAYYVNHPLYTAPECSIQMYVGLGAFLLCELGNLSIHIALRNLRPAGSKERKIPIPTSNPFTMLFNLVSCPNYTYEVGSWAAFTVMTQCLGAGLFTLVGFYQMAVWALGKQRLYKKEFSNYPRSRKSIVPFII